MNTMPLAESPHRSPRPRVSCDLVTSPDEPSRVVWVPGSAQRCAPKAPASTAGGRSVPSITCHRSAFAPLTVLAQCTVQVSCANPARNSYSTSPPLTHTHRIKDQTRLGRRHVIQQCVTSLTLARLYSLFPLLLSALSFSLLFSPSLSLAWSPVRLA